MGQRSYVAQFENVSIAAVQDIFSLKASGTKGFEIHQIELGSIGQTSPTEFRLSLTRVPVTMTQGSGGSVPTINPLDAGDSLPAVVVAHANDTTQSTSTGTIATLLSTTWNVLMPFQYLPAPEDRPTALVNQGVALTLNAAPGAATSVSGFIKWREFP